jgi:hypothetical protein
VRRAEGGEAAARQLEGEEVLSCLDIVGINDPLLEISIDNTSE